MMKIQIITTIPIQLNNLNTKKVVNKNVNIDYKNESVVKKYNKERRDLVNIIRGILIDMGEPDKAAYFMNSAELCINSIQEEEFKNCLLNKCDEIGNTLNINKNKIFKQKVKNFYNVDFIIYLNKL